MSLLSVKALFLNRTYSQNLREEMIRHHTENYTYIISIPLLRANIIFCPKGLFRIYMKQNTQENKLDSLQSKCLVINYAENPHLSPNVRESFPFCKLVSLNIYLFLASSSYLWCVGSSVVDLVATWHGRSQCPNQVQNTLPLHWKTYSYPLD